MKKVEVYFEWKLIDKDPDDNKYADAAVAGATDYIVSNGQHFKILKSVDFPKVNFIGIDEFLNLISRQ